MITQGLKHILLLALITVFTVSGSIQYMHSQDDHACEAHNEQHNDEDSCSLCLFFTQQVASDIAITVFQLPELFASLVTTKPVDLAVSYHDITLRAKPNKDPPL